MGEQAGVPIEPDEQTRLLDACIKQPGVIGGGVPGGWLFSLQFLSLSLYLLQRGDTMPSGYWLLTRKIPHLAVLYHTLKRFGRIGKN